MPLKQTIVTKVEPDSPGWYWYRDTPEVDWYPVRVLNEQVDGLCVYLKTTDPNPISMSELEGEWGDEIPLPKAAHKSQTVSSILPKENTGRTSHRRAPIKAPTESVIQPEKLAKFLYWISERHSIYLRRHALLTRPPGKVDPNKKSLIEFGPKTVYETALSSDGSYSYESPKPWTQDPVLQNNFFCNPFRELDKTTQWFRDNVRDPLRNSPDVIMATIIFRWFNYILTGEALIACQSKAETRVRKGQGPPRPKGSKVEHPGLGLFTNWSSSEALAILKPMKKVFTGAHVVASGTQLADTGPRDGGGSPKVRSILDLIDRLWSKREDIIGALRPDSPRLPAGNHGAFTLEHVHQYLQSFPAIGDFQAYEIVSDLRHTYVLENAPDILTWANAGPGAKRGLNRIFGRPIQFASPSHPWQTEMQALLWVASRCLLDKPIKGIPASTSGLQACLGSVDINFWAERQSSSFLATIPPLPKGHPPFELREVEHSLCEFDKYMRLAYPTPEDGGPQNSKRKYIGT